MSEETTQRSFPARVGIVALNFVAPGLGYLRVGGLRASIAFLLAPTGLLLVLIAAYALQPEITFRSWMAVTAALLFAAAVVIAVPVVATWRASRLIESARPWWSRWYVLVGAFALVVTINWTLPDLARSYYRTFYTPAEAMLPGLRVNDRLLASMRGGGELRRGDVILFEVGNHIYIKRVAALPGDRVAMRDGVVILNGQPIAQRLLGTEHIEGNQFGTQARRLAEQFPGEMAAHQIYDLGYSEGDNMAERRVPPGHVFVLGDNRDMSADSRFPRSLHGVEDVPIADIRGRALFYLWGPSSRMGEPINR